MRRTILLYGGAFNPPHLGHIRLLEAAIRACEPDLTLVVPSAVSPHKADGGVPFFHRASMAKCFLTLGSSVRISGIENSKKRQRSYTVKTLRRLRRRYPDAEIFLLMGEDMLASFRRWHSWRRILTLCSIAAGVRSGENERAVQRDAESLRRDGAKVLLLHFEPIEISSSELRRRIADGEETSQLLHPDVMQYIEQHRLYRKDA